MLNRTFALTLLALSAFAVTHSTSAQTTAKTEQNSSSSGYDAALAQRLGADARGGQKYVLVVLKTGPSPVAAGKERDEMFAGHFANMQRLANAGKLVLAGPFDGKDGWRGLFIFAVNNIDEARELTATDPVIIKGEMVAEYHAWYGSAGVMEIPAIHARLSNGPKP
ncbi:MAG: hypothetical protein E6Q34_08275 [Burkholderiaceae bacterium]|nr:MAG: hypothetical protein E6Q34_08275 [Burkholderiaceae bacterium]